MLPSDLDEMTGRELNEFLDHMAAMDQEAQNGAGR